MSKIWKLALAGVAATGLAACGDTVAERAIIGAGAGAATAAVVGGSVATGVVVGSAANLIYCKEYPGRC